ncbi:MULTISPECIES: penicillin-binding protein 1B [unclassified Pseudoalteromonas]|uniref:penicillin-binding protein 1B n=1 Tax=unclassified Pseudoalteromonas TaxID=194690 RepID=UPI001022D5D8|nr:MULTISPECIES: penicillin-binding protein 1B [Gammaproteobacteria]MCF7500767.1 penicillin-binding protein 1B [Pseudoalteromonas sp. L1]RZF92206.1 penicillin-binding protein 1B [Pseudoalteromonas sp. CO302Y]RZG08441.1 penicillin-binding protein 1B [Pseudoalteromonas sp. CO133X]UJX26301.1 penicillin-binding protein 1B [Pseudoalteromonas sp. CF6-2]WOC27094.1 penicillin-binding protein 1B [Pseudoalteromonas sp. N1230-9]
MADKKTPAKKTPAKKTASTKRTTKKRKTSSNTTVKSRIFRKTWSIFWKLSLAVVIAMVLYLIYLDAKITRQFEGNKWQLPAQVYARAMSFYPGQFLSQQEVLWELNRLNYSSVNKLSRTGQYVKSSNSIKVYRREFEFYDGLEDARVIELRFSGKKLATIKDKFGRRLNSARLEPVQIARIGNDSNQDREFVPLDKFPAMLKDTLLVVEDRDFYQHHGVSVWSIMRALYSNIKAGRTVQGGSTLTQQLAKNIYLTRERSLVRKFNEALIALILDYRYSKDEILEAYLNEVYLGQSYNQGVHGMGLAAEFYFSKPVDELEYDQIALLVAMVKGPSYYNPRRYSERAMERRDLVLRLMVENNLINTREYRASLKRPIDISPMKDSLQKSYPGYLELVNRELKRLLPDQQVLDAGVRVFTYFDLQKQTAMEKSVEASLPYLERRPKTEELEAAMISVNVEKGGVSALVAGRDVRYFGFNRVLDTKRNIGSLVKPAVYLSAFESGKFNLASLVDDSPLRVTNEQGKIWQPENFDRQFRGMMPLYKAFSNSINIPAVNTGLDVGVDTVATTLKRLGVEGSIDEYPSLLLGALELSSFEVAQLYTTLAADGQYRELTSISALTDSVGKVLYKHNVESQKRFDEASVYMTKYAMKRVTKDGTAKRLNAHFPSIQLAGKTGTSNDLRDSWFAGFDQNTVTVAWIGRDDNKNTGLTGSVGALETYIRYLKPLNPEAIADTRPASIRWAFINEETGLQAPPGCGKVVQLPIRASEFEPRPSCRR